MSTWRPGFRVGERGATTALVPHDTSNMVYATISPSSLPAFSVCRCVYSTAQLPAGHSALDFRSGLSYFTPAVRVSSKYCCYRSRRVLHSMESDFSSPMYWDRLYTDEDADAQATEWHLESTALMEPLERCLGTPRDDAAILNVGCGTSMLWASMYDGGWRNITNIDFSEKCIEQGMPLSTGRPGVRWMVADACNLSAERFPDHSFDCAVDKGTVDAIACSEAFDWLLPRMAHNIARVLRPNGTWICVSFTKPGLVLPLLQECEEWTVKADRLESFWMYVGTKR